MCSREAETTLSARCIVGVDEVGRGCLAGPVTVCACHIPLDVDVRGVKDSKQLSERQREALFRQLTTHPRVKFAVVSLPAAEIDRLNILQATLEAMRQAVVHLLDEDHVPVDVVWVDGNQKPPNLEHRVPVQTIPHGDQTHYPIAAASIIAKVTRDRLMREYDNMYPGYGLAQHKGYPTGQHKEALETLGITPLHRRSFRGVKHLVH